MQALLDAPARALARATALRTLVSQIRSPHPDKVLSLEAQLVRLARPEDVERYLAALRACPATARMLEERWMPPPYTLDDLARCAPGTLGRVYHDHMIENDLRPDFFEAIDRSDDFAFVRQRMYQTHDLWHVATGYPTSVLGEMAIVGFYLGHFDRWMGDRAAPAVTFSAILASTMLMHAALFRQDRIPHFHRALIDGWARGRQAEPLFAVRWEEQWDRPLADLRRELRIGPSSYARIEPVALAA